MLPYLRKKKLTLVVIPEANSQVRQFRVSLLSVYLIPSAVLVLAAVTIALVLLHGTLVETNIRMKADWAGDRQSLVQTVQHKDNEIERLQNELAKLVSESEQIRTKVEELQALEQELLSITDSGTETTAKKEAVPVALTTDHSEGRSVGGEFYPARVDEMIELSESTRTSLSELESEAGRLQTALKDAKKHAERLAYIRSITPSIYPTESKRITSVFGYRKDPFTRKSAFHRGIDFSGDMNDPVYATAAGKVSRTGYDRAMGNHVFINHGNGLETVYMHLNKTTVKHGEWVEKGDKIGLLGSTGRSTGPHLHYEVHRQGTPIDPIPYVKPKKRG